MMAYTESDIDSVRFKVQEDKWVNHIHLSEGDLLTLVDITERNGVGGDRVVEYELEAPTGQTFTIMDSELSNEDAFKEM